MSISEEECNWEGSISLWEEVPTRDNTELFVKQSNTKTKKKKNNNNKKNKPSPKFLEEIFFHILTRLPVDLLHKKFRYVCKQWNNTISSPFFINQSMLQSKPIHIVQSLLSMKTKILEIKDDGNLELACHPYPQCCTYKELREFRSSCNGLILVSYPRKPGLLRVMNPVIKKDITLPSCPSHCTHESGGCGMGIAFSPSTGEYKVGHILSDSVGFEIFTLGSLDKSWRIIPAPFRGIYDRPFGEDFNWYEPVLFNENMLHWDLNSEKYIISLNVSDEKLCKTYLPIQKRSGGDVKKKTRDMIELGGFLCVVYVSRIGFDVWILKDFEKKEWIKQHSVVADNVRYVNSVGRMPRLDNLYSVATVGRFILFMFKHCGSKSGLYIYDTEFNTLTKFKMKVKLYHTFIPHLHTLNWIKDLGLEDELNQINPGLNLEATGVPLSFESMAQSDSDLEEELGEDEEEDPGGGKSLNKDKGSYASKMQERCPAMGRNVRVMQA